MELLFEGFSLQNGAVRCFLYFATVLYPIFIFRAFFSKNSTVTSYREIHYRMEMCYHILLRIFLPTESVTLLARWDNQLGFLLYLEISRVKNELFSTTEKGNEINCMDFSKEGFSFATAGKDLAVRIYDTNTNQV